MKTIKNARRHYQCLLKFAVTAVSTNARSRSATQMRYGRWYHATWTRWQLSLADPMERCWQVLYCCQQCHILRPSTQLRTDTYEEAVRIWVFWRISTLALCYLLRKTEQIYI